MNGSGKGNRLPSWTDVVRTAGNASLEVRELARAWARQSHGFPLGSHPPLATRTEGEDARPPAGHRAMARALAGG
jgi:hypothetical protein